MHNTQLFSISPYMRLMNNAPLVTIAEGIRAFPQHYYVYEHNVFSISQIIANIDVDDSVLIFADMDSGGMYVQIGLIGVESYRALRDEPKPKIVYGRKWRIDTDMPTPEIVQTVFLAVQKAKEHEVRELLLFKPKNRKSFATPFSSHQDVDLLKRVSDAKVDTYTKLLVRDEDSAATALAQLQFAGRPFILKNCITLPDNRLLIDATLNMADAISEPIPEEFIGLTFSILIETTVSNSLYYRLIEFCIAKSNQHIVESFAYKNFTRFSETLSPELIAEVSLNSRPYTEQMKNVAFTQVFKMENAKVDSARVPSMGVTPLTEINLTKLQKESVLHGFLPTNLVCEHKSWDCN